MESARAKSGPSGITIMKSMMLMNWTDASRKMSFRSDIPGDAANGGGGDDGAPLGDESTEDMRAECSRAGRELSASDGRPRGASDARWAGAPAAPAYVPQR